MGPTTDIDLRSDTVTRPTPAMLEAMMEAVVGDDARDGDPTVRGLERRAADVLEKEDAIFVPSGTMGNLLAHLCRGSSGSVVIGPAGAHTFVAEDNGLFRLAGMEAVSLRLESGSVSLEDLESAIGNSKRPVSSVVVEEPYRGFVTPLSRLAAIATVARTAKVPLHMDGARIFNAAVHLGVPASEIAAHAQSVMFCLSKGLGAPVGSLLVGSAAFVEEARGWRRMLGGSMRQAGYLAAAGLYALSHNVDRLAEDHANAQRLADGLRSIRGLHIDRKTVETNMFYVQVSEEVGSAGLFSERMGQRGVKVSAGPWGVRFVTHLGLGAGDIPRVLEAAKDAMSVPEGLIQP